MVEINNKQKTVFICLIVVFYLFVTIFLINNFLKKKESDFYLIVDDYTLLIRSDGIWTNETDSMEVPKERFAVYQNGEYQDAYYLQYNNKWFIYDDNDKVVKRNGALLAYNGKKLLDVISVEDEAIASEDYNNIDSAILELNYPTYGEISVFDKFVYDIDNNKKDETLYTVSNVYSEKEEEKYYSIVFFVTEDDIVIVDSDINSDRYSTATFELSYLIDTDNNKKYEFLVMTDYFSNPENPCQSLYEYDKEVIELVGC